MRAFVATWVAALAGLVLAVPAPAATVANTTPAELDFIAGVGEANRVTISRSGNDLVVTDLGVSGFTVYGTCAVSPNDSHTVTCPAAGTVAYDANGADLDDTFTVDASLTGTLLGGAGADVLRGGPGNERIDGGAGADILDGGAGNDRLFGATFQDAAAGTEADQLAGGDGDDQLFGSGGANQLDGGAGQDVLRGGGGNDHLGGGDGIDQVVGDAGDDVQDGGAGADTIGTDVNEGVDNHPVDVGNDQLLGGPGDDTILPGPGAPFPDADVVSGGDGQDSVTYANRMTPVGVSKDTAPDDGDPTEHDNVALDVETLVGGTANDTMSGGPGDDTIDGGAGDDTIAGLAGQDALTGDGGPAAGTDTIAGGDGNDRVNGDGGGDALEGGAGADDVGGGDGRDTLTGGPGADTINGGTGTDVANYTGASTDVTVRLDAGQGSTGENDTDKLVLIEDVDGGSRGNTLTGTADANQLEGGTGEDYLDGRAGVDLLDGGGGADVIASRDNVRDQPVSCGPGSDFAIIDRRDRAVRSGPNRCELVDNGTDRRPRGGRVLVGGTRKCASQFSLPGMHRRVPLEYDVLLPSGYRGRSAPTLEPGDCDLSLTVATTKRRRVSAVVSGDAVALAQTPGRTVTTALTVKRPDCLRTALRTLAPIRDPQVRVTTQKRPGRWRVKGRHSIAASVGTDWTTVEGCSTTTTIVHRGRVRVTNRVTGRTIEVRAGHRYVARKR